MTKTVRRKTSKSLTRNSIHRFILSLRDTILFVTNSVICVCFQIPKLQSFEVRFNLDKNVLKVSLTDCLDTHLGVWHWNSCNICIDDTHSIGSKGRRRCINYRASNWRHIWGKRMTRVFLHFIHIPFCIQGVTFPCIHAVWSQWAPPMERSRMATIAFAGNYAGTIVSMPLSGILASAFGWESLFYVFGMHTNYPKIP